MMKIIAAILSAVVFCLCPQMFAEAGAIQFDFDSISTDPRIGAPSDLSWEAIGRPFYPEADGRYLVDDFAIRLMSGEYRGMLTCSSLDGNHACLGIQLSVADESETPAIVIQRLELGDGYVPEIITAPGDAYSIMFRTIRAGDNTEAYVYSINPLTGRLDQTLVITRNFPERIGLEITGTMKPGGVVEIASEQPFVRGTVNMAEALDALIEDEIYQPDGNPISAFENLRLIRGGWEEEDFYSVDGETRVNAGMTLMTLSGNPVIDVTAVLIQDANRDWTAVELRFEPALPYK